jgi:signal recognition particle subunit SRP54
MARLGQMLGMGGGLPTPTPEQIEALQKQMGGKLPGPPGAGSGIPDAPPPGAFTQPPPFPGLSVLSSPRLPGLGGGAQFNPFAGKKK